MLPSDKIELSLQLSNNGNRTHHLANSYLKGHQGKLCPGQKPQGHFFPLFQFSYSYEELGMGGLWGMSSKTGV